MASEITGEGGSDTLQPPPGAHDNLFNINPDYLKPEFAAQVQEVLAGNSETSKPFPHMSLKNFVTDEKVVDMLREELLKVPFQKRENDLYTFSRTTDIQNLDATVYPALKAFRKFLATKVKEFMGNISGEDLVSRVDCAGSKYEQFDVLLPHDDRMEDRKFAFIYYLTPEWESSWGGDLKLYESDEHNLPTGVGKSITPANNSFLFFHIDHSLKHTSWHCVEEVTEAGKARISLNGWFHVDEAEERTKINLIPKMEKITPTLDIQYEDVRKWINPLYIAQQEQKAIKRIFANKSELRLDNFLSEEMYKQALAELKTAKYYREGPVNHISADRLDESALTKDSALAQIFRLVRSEAMTLLITQWTGLHLYDLNLLVDSDEPPSKKQRTEENPQKDVKVISFINKMSQGCFSLCDDQMAADAANNGFCFDLLIFFMEKENWDKLGGGYYSFIAVNDPHEILRVSPAPNSAAFVFREPEVLSFIKYINSRVGDDCYYVLNCSYFGVTSGESDSEASDISDDNSFGEDFDEIEPEDDDNDDFDETEHDEPASEEE